MPDSLSGSTSAGCSVRPYRCHIAVPPRSPYTHTRRPPTCSVRPTGVTSPSRHVHLTLTLTAHLYTQQQRNSTFRLSCLPSIIEQVSLIYRTEPTTKKWKTEKLGSGTETHRRAAGVGGMLNSVDTTVARNAHVRRRQTASWRPEVPLRACLAATSGCIVRTVDTLATAAQLVPCGFRVQRRVVDTAGGVAVALAPSTGIAVC